MFSGLLPSPAFAVSGIQPGDSLLFIIAAFCFFLDKTLSLKYDIS
jgi:hypothetical protein